MVGDVVDAHQRKLTFAADRSEQLEVTYSTRPGEMFVSGHNGIGEGDSLVFK
jgi:hypothetical protein